MIQLIFFGLRLRQIWSQLQVGLMKDFENLIKKFGGREKIYHAGDVIYDQESGIEGIYYLKNGKIRIDNSRVKSKRDVLVWLLCSGNFFGLSSYYNGYVAYSYITTVISEKAEVILISRDDFIRLLKAEKEFRAYIINLLYRRMDYIEQRKTYSSKVSFLKKLADAIVFLSPSHAVPSVAENNKPLRIEVSISELAAITNANRKQLLQSLDELCNKKILDRDGESITVRNFEKLIHVD